MTLIVLEQAEKEFSKSAGYYESKEPGLGIRFRDEVAAGMDWILEHPAIPRLRARVLPGTVRARPDTKILVEKRWNKNWQSWP